MLDEFRPLMCPFDVSMGKGMAYLDMFLPTFNVAHVRESTYLLWFDELMSFWQACLNSAPFETVNFTILLSIISLSLFLVSLFWDACVQHVLHFQSIMYIMARLADNNIGLIDWEPYVPMIFTRIQRNFHLPVMYKHTSIGMSAPASVLQSGRRVGAGLQNPTKCSLFSTV